MSSRLMRFAPVRSAHFVMPPREGAKRRTECAVRAAPPATPGPGQTPPAPEPPPMHPDDMPPEIQDPTPVESPVPVREPPVMPPPMGMGARPAVREAFATTR